MSLLWLQIRVCACIIGEPESKGSVEVWRDDIGKE